MATYRYSKYDSEPLIDSEAYSVEQEGVPRNGAMASWLFRDPLRGIFNIDKFPYHRDDGELKLDFIFKCAIYGPFFALSFLDGGFFLFLFVALWGGINFLRRNS